MKTLLHTMKSLLFCYYSITSLTCPLLHAITAYQLCYHFMILLLHSSLWLLSWCLLLSKYIQWKLWNNWSTIENYGSVMTYCCCGQCSDDRQPYCSISRHLAAVHKRQLALLLVAWVLLLVAARTNCWTTDDDFTTPLGTVWSFLNNKSDSISVSTESTSQIWTNCLSLRQNELGAVLL